MKKILGLFIFLATLLVISFAFTKNQKENQISTYFLGDKLLAKKGYFDNLTEDKGFPIIKKQNDLYEKNYSEFNDIVHDSNSNLKFKLQKVINEKKYRIILYTILNNKKKDSIDFYENIANIRGKDDYYCLSYLDLKKNEIWQIKVFSSKANKNLSFISFAKKKVTKSGNIKTDSLYYLDESLELELYNFKTKS
ncbi:hypothetical protein [Flavobacterium sp. 245]|uniref:hypothetical protein n=1 Tax=Flavobacterium sp. 245 TaxID=2512115 RepID=UPI00105D61D2|nr:hypothetical protein [Flavobacterium sp. 245]TDO94968.1 hypothetical protein EV145_11557 [Flavobacterium sp. 245]